MKVLVCISQVPDTVTKIVLKDNNKTVEENGITFIINPYDEWYALVRALEFKEAGIADAVHLITVGRANTEPVIRKALALGGDEAIRIDADSNDPYVTAGYIAEYAKNEAYDLVLCGKETIDYANGAVGPMLAELLDIDFIGFATAVNIAGTIATVKREIDGGEETDTASLPLVISCQKGVAEARIPNMRGIMAARTKPLKTISPTAIEPLTTVAHYELPPAKAGVKLIAPDQMDELVNLLHAEAKVI
ncbi:electron transfer flavoprotein subunit beta/FixA family protein [Mucilaginibacter phyllosphaerae]|uniref:Electron transfer flavoprotein subunit beta n=1 Tax=Mucilaginibacter phyllosphaerae TaxID=1812349 RepID=A0A4Y8A698_9SPHI|nr:electron transfer flavoprotein subunit beta/FixA family protein [Mucilaginibacter phyllosphaerae]MBB3971129.1 electron transfer flavoprotein beta subunit [Mucilaginibacter phyllosphaerae]TEW63859.1 electron transfer flavoprotein beta subunit/FixA family protein [Mucilaginibacter phyllosphaerae]GGH22647.1 electron transfer flavoprotein subunit alpha [Mucilaginibacter phyllosphaerae]